MKYFIPKAGGLICCAGDTFPLKEFELFAGFELFEVFEDVEPTTTGLAPLRLSALRKAQNKQKMLK